MSADIIINIDRILFLFGVFSLFLFVLFEKYLNQVSPIDFLHIALFAVLVSISFRGISNGSYSESLVLFSVSFIPVIGLLSRYCDRKYIKFSRIISSMACIIATVLFFIDVLGILDINMSFSVIFITAFVGYLFSFIVYMNIVITKSSDLIFIVSNGILFAGLISGAFFTSKFIILLSSISFVFLIFISVFRRYSEDYRISVFKYIHEQNMYNDILTSLGNRKAFEKQLEEDDKMIYDFSSYWAISIDINNLKYINNNFGYIQGDKIIQNLADTIDDVFSDTGKCFRIGSDEFTVLIKDLTKPEVEKYISLFYSMINSYNTINDIELSVAMGYDYFKPGYDQSVYDLLARTDSMMACNKRKVKASRFKSFGEDDL